VPWASFSECFPELPREIGTKLRYELRTVQNNRGWVESNIACEHCSEAKKTPSCLDHKKNFGGPIRTEFAILCIIQNVSGFIGTYFEDYFPLYDVL